MAESDRDPPGKTTTLRAIPMTASPKSAGTPVRHCRGHQAAHHYQHDEFQHVIQYDGAEDDLRLAAAREELSGGKVSQRARDGTVLPNL